MNERRFETKVIRIDADRPDPEAIREAAGWIRRGEPVAFPTETVYGLGADALCPGAAKRIYEAKGRPSDNPLIIHIADMDALAEITSGVPPQAHALAEAFWPGPLTMILPKSSHVPYETTGGLETVAVRMPSHPAALALIAESGGFIAAPSANTSGRPSPTRAEHVLTDLGGRIPLILDGGPSGIGLESTIIDLSTETAAVLRPGYIDGEMLRRVIGSVRTDPGLHRADNAAPKAPGMKYRHYAPRAQLVLVAGSRAAVTACIIRCVREKAREHISCGILCAEETRHLYPQGVVKSIGYSTDEDAIAHNLYRVLRAFDETGVSVIYSEEFETPRLGGAIMNRLLKAAGYQRIEAKDA